MERLSIRLEPLTVVDLGSTTLATYDYDQLGRRALVQYNGTTGAKMVYAWSVEGDLNTLQNDFTGTANDVSYTNTFTPAHQWNDATTSNAAFRYVPQTTATTAFGTVNTVNQYPTIGGTAYDYDTRGNFLGPHTTGTHILSYDAENHFMGNAGPSAVYAYDPLGRNTKHAVGSTVTNFVHDGDTQIADYDGSGTLLRRYVPGPTIDDYIAMVTAAGTKTFFHVDKMGSVVAMSDMSGNLSEGPYRYDPYGTCISPTGGSCTTGVMFRYTGQRYDSETNLYYYRARMYSPAQGRFLQVDPIGYKSDINLYSYVGGDPTNEVDPTGEFLWPWESVVTVTGGTRAQRMHYRAVVERVLSTPGGQELRALLIGPWYWHGTPVHIKLQPGIKEETGAVQLKSPLFGKYLSGEVDIDPDWHPLIETTAGAIPAADERVVGHEIGHVATGTKDDGPGDMNNVNQNENPIMKALKQPARTQYAPAEGASGNGTGSGTGSGLDFSHGGDKPGTEHLCTGSHIATSEDCR